MGRSRPVEGPLQVFFDALFPEKIVYGIFLAVNAKPTPQDYVSVVRILS
jgi:hypothetical protein